MLTKFVKSTFETTETNNENKIGRCEEKEEEYIYKLREPSFKARHIRKSRNIFATRDVLSLEIFVQQISISDQSEEIQFVRI